MHRKRVFEDFEIKHFGEYHDLYVKSDTLFSANIFENFRKKCKISFNSRISMARSFLKKTRKVIK